MTKIFIDGSAGTTGLQIHERLKQRNDITLLKLNDDLRKVQSQIYTLGQVKIFLIKPILFFYVYPMTLLSKLLISLKMIIQLLLILQRLTEFLKAGFTVYRN